MMTRMIDSMCPSECHSRGYCFRIEGEPRCFCQAGFEGDVCQFIESTVATIEDTKHGWGVMDTLLLICICLVVIGFYCIFMGYRSRRKDPESSFELQIIEEA
ncbi:EGF-like domain-containing protein [Caenorhabditis elegans]|uniref:EGF-like domain-containing protein n=1 Tax=Caenorhabditis elegans TaxID=6239 RepID=P91363_CAEEL|nr:EGF-like domain-containing protein [Caenorhabditis elegans]CCD69097.2 EGF-like domain-containing protein [Caenorhabditis elegans]|eukprot:NP_508290.2 Uncharacterized protein CELE_K06A9.3 [Caenorhabditis elegans]